MVNAQQEPQAPWDLTKLRPVLQLFLRQLMEMGRGRDPSPRLRSSLAECVERASNMLHLYVVVVEIAGSVKPFNPAAELAAVAWRWTCHAASLKKANQHNLSNNGDLLYLVVHIHREWTVGRRKRILVKVFIHLTTLVMRSQSRETSEIVTLLQKKH